MLIIFNTTKLFTYQQTRNTQIGQKETKLLRYNVDFCSLISSPWNIVVCGCLTLRSVNCEDDANAYIPPFWSAWLQLKCVDENFHGYFDASFGDSEKFFCNEQQRRVIHRQLELRDHRDSERNDLNCHHCVHEKSIMSYHNMKAILILPPVIVSDNAIVQIGTMNRCSYNSHILKKLANEKKN